MLERHFEVPAPGAWAIEGIQNGPAWLSCCGTVVGSLVTASTTEPKNQALQPAVVGWTRA